MRVLWGMLNSFSLCRYPSPTVPTPVRIVLRSEWEPRAAEGKGVELLSTPILLLADCFSLGEGVIFRIPTGFHPMS